MTYRSIREMAPNMIVVPTGGPAFTVPASGCARIGLITFGFCRLRQGPLGQQGSVAGQLAHGMNAYFVVRCRWRSHRDISGEADPEDIR